MNGEPVRVLICGSDWTDEDAILAQIFTLPHKSVIVRNTCPCNVAAIADYWGRYLLYEVQTFPDAIGQGNPDLIWVFTPKLAGETTTLVQKVSKKKIEVKIFGCDEAPK